MTSSVGRGAQESQLGSEGRPTDDPAHTLAEPWRPDMSAESWDKLCQRTDLLCLCVPLCVASMKNRKWLDWFKSTPGNGKDVLDTIELGEKGTLGTKLNLLGGLITPHGRLLDQLAVSCLAGSQLGSRRASCVSGCYPPPAHLACYGGAGH